MSEQEQDAGDADESDEVDDDGRSDLNGMLDGVVDDDFDPEQSEFDDIDPELVERVAESDPETVASELAALRLRVDALESQLETREEEVDDLESKLKRKQADFQNYKKRMEKRREEEKQRATEDLVERLLDVRDNLLRALDQEANGGDIRDGVERTLGQFDSVLAEENVEVVEPEPGEEVDPHTHEVLMRVDSDQPADTIADVSRPGYVMAEKVLRPAQVTVSEGGDDESDDAS
jgi:molecular chaperone GrpE